MSKLSLILVLVYILSLFVGYYYHKGVLERERALAVEYYLQVDKLKAEVDVDKQTIKELQAEIMQLSNEVKIENEKYQAVRAKYDKEIKEYKTKYNVIVKNEMQGRAKIEDYKNALIACNEVIDKQEQLIKQNEHRIKLITEENNKLVKLADINRDAMLKYELMLSDKDKLINSLKQGYNKQNDRYYLPAILAGAFILGVVIAK